MSNQQTTDTQSEERTQLRQTLQNETATLLELSAQLPQQSQIHFEKHITSLRKKWLNVLDSANDVHNSNRQLLEHNEQLLKRNSELQEEGETSKREHQSLVDTLRSQHKSELNASRAQHRSELNASREEITNLGVIVATKNAEIDELSDENNFVQEALKDSQDEAGALSDEINVLKQTIQQQKNTIEQQNNTIEQQNRTIERLENTVRNAVRPDPSAPEEVGQQRATRSQTATFREPARSSFNTSLSSHNSSPDSSQRSFLQQPSPGQNTSTAAFGGNIFDSITLPPPEPSNKRTRESTSDDERERGSESPSKLHHPFGAMHVSDARNLRATDRDEPQQSAVNDDTEPHDTDNTATEHDELQQSAVTEDTDPQAGASNTGSASDELRQPEAPRRAGRRVLKSFDEILNTIMFYNPDTRQTQPLRNIGAPIVQSLKETTLSIYQNRNNFQQLTVKPKGPDRIVCLERRIRRTGQNSLTLSGPMEEFVCDHCERCGIASLVITMDSSPTLLPRAADQREGLAPTDVRYWVPPPPPSPQPGPA